MQRRRFLQTISAATASAAAAPPAAPAPADTPIKLGFDTYSVRAFKWKAPQLLEFAAGLKLDTIQFSDLADYESHDKAYLQKIKDQAARLNIAVDGGMGCIGPLSKSFHKTGPPVRDQLLEGLRICRDVGAKVMRCYMGSSADRIGEPGIEANMEATIKLFQSVRSQALDTGVKIALENHAGDMQAREVRTIIEESGKDFVGSNLDTGNPIWVVEDPFVTLEVLAPYVVTSHMRDSAVFETPGARPDSGWRWATATSITSNSFPSSAASAPIFPCSSKSSPAARPRSCPISRPISGRSFRRRRPPSSRASWRWPRADIPSWAPW